MSTQPEIAVGTDFHARRSTKTISVFLPVDVDASWSLLHNAISFNC